MAGFKLVTKPMPEIESPTQPSPLESAPFGVHAPVMPLYYFNGFALQYGTGDFTLLLKVDNQQQIILKMSYTVGKTLSEALAKMVGEFEQITSHNIMTSDEVKDSIMAKRQHAATRKN